MTAWCNMLVYVAYCYMYLLFRYTKSQHNYKIKSIYLDKITENHQTVLLEDVVWYVNNNLNVNVYYCLWCIPVNVIGLYNFIYTLYGCLLNTYLHNILFPNETLLVIILYQCPILY